MERFRGCHRGNREPQGRFNRSQGIPRGLRGCHETPGELRSVSGGYKRPQERFRRSQELFRGFQGRFRGFQGVPKKFQSVAWAFQVLQEVLRDLRTFGVGPRGSFRGYRELKGVSGTLCKHIRVSQGSFGGIQGFRGALGVSQGVSGELQGNSGSQGPFMVSQEASVVLKGFQGGFSGSLGLSILFKRN